MLNIFWYHQNDNFFEIVLSIPFSIAPMYIIFVRLITMEKAIKKKKIDI